MTLTDFLLARIAEDEAVARAALAPAEMHPYGDRALPQTRPDQVPDEMRGYLGGTWGEHAARWDMSRVLAECEAKRAIVDRAWAEIDSQDPPRASAIFATGVLLVLAAVYADHADFNPAWSTQ